jgi:hypothetical protein
MGRETEESQERALRSAERRGREKKDKRMTSRPGPKNIFGSAVAPGLWSGRKDAIAAGLLVFLFSGCQL